MLHTQTQTGAQYSSVATFHKTQEDNCKLNEYSIQLHPSRYQCGPVYLTPVTEFMVSSCHDTRGQCHDVTLSRVTCDDTTPGPDNLRYPGQHRAHRHKQWVSLTTNKKSIQEKF